MSVCIALIRGINVGRANRIAMADLRTLAEELGHTHVRTLLNSGNVVFKTARARVHELARSLEGGIEAEFGISARVIVVTAAEIDSIVQENPLGALANDPARHVVAFVADGADLAKAQPLLDRQWAPEAFATGSIAGYLWCAGGILDSKLAKAFSRLVGDAATTRNWTTVLKLQAAARELL